MKYGYLNAGNLDEAARLLNRTCGPGLAVRFVEAEEEVFALTESPCESNWRRRVLGTYTEGVFQPFAEFGHWSDAGDGQVLRLLRSALKRRRTDAHPTPLTLAPADPETEAVYRRDAGLVVKSPGVRE